MFEELVASKYVSVVVITGERREEFTELERLLLIIVPSVSGGLLLCACLIILCLCCCCQCRKRMKAKDYYSTMRYAYYMQEITFSIELDLKCPCINFMYQVNVAAPL